MVTREAPEEATEDGHPQRFTVSKIARGWEVCEREGARVVRTSRYTDWHRVERAVQVFELRGRALQKAPD